MKAYHRTLSITFFSILFAILGSSAYAKKSTPNNSKAAQIELNPNPISSQSPLALSFQEAQAPSLTLQLENFSRDSVLQELDTVFPESSLIPTVLSLFTHSAYDSLSAFGSPKVVIRSISPVRMTFLFTFNFGEA